MGDLDLACTIEIEKKRLVSLALSVCVGSLKEPASTKKTKTQSYALTERRQAIAKKREVKRTFMIVVVL